MITFVQGDLLTADVDALVNPVNCVGVMGKGLAKQFKSCFPDYYRDYKRACDKGELTFRTVHFYQRDGQWLISVPTKNHWRDKTDPNELWYTIYELGYQIRKRNIRSVAIPALGCGEGGLQWEYIKSWMVNIFGWRDFQYYDIRIYEPWA